MGAFAETLAPHVGRVDAFEKDLLTARIAQSLHPLGQSTIFVQIFFKGVHPTYVWGEGFGKCPHS